MQKNRKDVIKIYEIGLANYIQSKGLRVGALYSHSKYFEDGNASVFAIKELIDDGFPVIKKKIIFRTFSKVEFFDLLKHPFHHDPNYYIRLIQKKYQ